MFRYVAIAVLLLWTLFPIVYLALTSLKPSAMLLDVPPRIFFLPSLEHFIRVFQFDEGIVSALTNSIIVSIVSTVLAVLIGAMAAFAFVHFSFVGKRTLLFSILATRMFPPITTVIPIYLLVSYFELVDTRTALILPYIAFQLPLVIWILIDFIRQIPKELQESAVLDGCGTMGVFFRIVLPLSIPGLLAAGVLAFIYNWNELLFALVLTSLDARTLPVALVPYTESEGMLQWGSVSVLGIVTMLPVLFFFIALNRALVKGMMAGAVKT